MITALKNMLAQIDRWPSEDQEALLEAARSLEAERADSIAPLSRTSPQSTAASTTCSQAASPPMRLQRKFAQNFTPDDGEAVALPPGLLRLRLAMTAQCVVGSPSDLPVWTRRKGPDQPMSPLRVSPTRRSDKADKGPPVPVRGKRERGRRIAAGHVDVGRVGSVRHRQRADVQCAAVAFARRAGIEDVP